MCQQNLGRERDDMPQISSLNVEQMQERAKRETGSSKAEAAYLQSAVLRRGEFKGWKQYNPQSSSGSKDQVSQI